MPRERSKEVLIVDDSGSNRFLVHSLLKERYQTRMAGSGEEALKAIAENLPDLILLDVIMPGQDGHAVCRELQSDLRTRDIPIIFLTGQNDQADEVKGFEIGAMDYITKPISPPVLQARVKTHLERATLFQEKNYVAELLRKTLLPEVAPTLCGVETGHRFLPSKLLSGDFIDLIPIEKRKLGVVIADVAGKGPDAAIQTVRAKYLIRAWALAGLDPAEILNRLNHQLDLDPGARNLTAFFATLDLDGGLLTYCNAGHEPARLWNPQRGCWEELESTAMMLGVMHPLEAEQRSLELTSGTCLLLFTDGVSEARSPQGDFLPLESWLEKATPTGAEGLVEALYQELEHFAAGQFSDDVTMLALRVP